jgi:tetratricopeptide (TPR) repeat protein
MRTPQQFWALMAGSVVLLSATVGVAFAQNPEAARLYEQGIDQYTKGNLPAAVSLFEQSVKKDPTYADAQYNLGSVYYQQGRYDKAQTAFRKALDVNPGDMQAKYSLALSYEKNNQLKDAIWLYKQIPSSDPKYANAQRKLPELTKRYNDQQAASAAAAKPTNYSSPNTTTSKPATTASKPVNTTPMLNKVGTKPTASAAKQSVETFAEGFLGPTGITQGPDGAIFVANYSKNRIDKVATNGQRTTYAEGGELNGPIGLVYDTANGNLYTANYLKNNVVRITPFGEQSVLASGLKKPYYLLLDNRNRALYVSEQETNTVSKIKVP